MCIRDRGDTGAQGECRKGLLTVANPVASDTPTTIFFMPVRFQKTGFQWVGLLAFSAHDLTRMEVRMGLMGTLAWGRIAFDRRAGVP